MGLTARVEDYLESVLEIEMRGENATITELAGSLGVTKATVVATMKRMETDNLLEHERYGHVTLTDEGRARALCIYRRHTFLTDFFVRILGFSHERAQKVSCVMEHEIDEYAERRLASFTDALIQAERAGDEWLRNLQVMLDSPNTLCTPLCMMPDGSGGSIARVMAPNELYKRLSSTGLVPNAVIKNIKADSDGRKRTFTFTMNDIQLSVGISEASAIWLYQPD
jgi:DtxR family Mn-dependent transcriptional regulator